MSAPAYVTLTGPQTTVMPISGTLAASAGAGTVVTTSIQAFGPSSPATQSVNVPITEVWKIIDMYVIGSYTPDAIMQLFINGYQQNINPDLNSMNLNLLTRFKLAQSVVLPPASTWFVNLVSTAANGTSAVTYTLYYTVVRAPYAPAPSK